jgi:hypothetical protein
MAGIWIVLVYGSSLALALLLLYFFRTHWYWHALSVLAALAIGSVPTPAEWKSPTFDLLIGSVFVLLLVWGIAAPFFHPHQHHREKHA